MYIRNYYNYILRNVGETEQFWEYLQEQFSVYYFMFTCIYGSILGVFK